MPNLRHLGKARMTPTGFPFARHTGGSQAIINLINSFSPSVLLVAGSGMLQTVGGTPVAAQGDPVGQWLDQSGNGRHAVQATAGKRPTYNLAVANGKPSASFAAASSQVMEGPLTYAGSAFTGVCVFRDLTGGGSTVPRLLSTSISSGTTDNTAFSMLLTSSTSHTLITADNGAGSIASGAYTTSVFNSCSGDFQGATIDVTLNGATTSVGLATPISITVYNVGADSAGSAGFFLNGDICLAAFWTSLVSSANLAIIQAALKTYYGTP